MTWEPNRRYRYKSISRMKMLRKLVSSHKMIFNIYIYTLHYVHIFLSIWYYISHCITVTC